MIYPVAIALARPSLSGLRSSGAPLPVTFAVTNIVAIAAAMICAGLIASRRAYPDQGGTWRRPRRPRARPCTAAELPLSARQQTSRTKTGPALNPNLVAAVTAKRRLSSSAEIRRRNHPSQAEPDQNSRPRRQIAAGQNGRLLRLKIAK